MSGVDCYECRAELCVLAQNARLALSTVDIFLSKNFLPAFTISTSAISTQDKI